MLWHRHVGLPQVRYVSDAEPISICVASSCSFPMALSLCLSNLSITSLPGSVATPSRNDHQVVGQDTPSDPPLHSFFTFIHAPVKPIGIFQGANASLTAGPPPYQGPKPAAALYLLASSRKPAFYRNGYPFHSQAVCFLFVLGGPESPVCGNLARNVPKPLLVPLQRRYEKHTVARVSLKHSIVRNKTVFHFIDLDESPEFCWLVGLALPNGTCLGLKQAEYLVRVVRYPFVDPDLGLLEDSFNPRKIRFQLSAYLLCLPLLRCRKMAVDPSVIELVYYLAVSVVTIIDGMMCEVIEGTGRMRRMVWG